MRKSPFIEGFREPTLSKNSFVMLADVRGDGEGKLLIWSQQQNKIIVYKGTDRQLEKDTKVKNVSGMISYNDEEKSIQPVIALSAENGLYIFRGLAQSFRLRIPDIFAQAQEQVLWSQYENDPQRLTEELSKLDKKLLSQTAQYLLGASTKQKKLQLISQAFSQGINEKDSISSVTVIRDNQAFSVGNVVLGTQLRRLYILDNYGHSIIYQRVISFVPFLLFAHGQYTSKYLIICVSREGIIQLHCKIDSQPIQTIKLSNRVVSGVLYFPDFLIVTSDQIIRHYSMSNSNFKIGVSINTIKLNQQPVKVDIIKTKNYKCMLVAFQNQFRLYHENQLVYTHLTDFKLYNTIFGSYGREEGCLILLYQKNGFEVLILHRQFNPKDKYGFNRIKEQLKQSDAIPIPKKTPQFMSFWRDQLDDNASYRLYERSLRMLKWKTLKQRLKEGTSLEGQIQINSKILGMGPSFIVKLQMENTSDKAIYAIDVLLSYPSDAIQIIKWENKIKMLPPFTPYFQQIQLTSISKKNQQINVQLTWRNNVVSSVVFIPNCEELGQ